MAGAVGSPNASLVYDLDAWVVPVGASSDLNVMIRGDASVWETDFSVAKHHSRYSFGHPINPGAGRVIFTTFHNEAQMTSDMEAALKEIILSL